MSAHFILQGKGGVGKSLVSAMLAQNRTDLKAKLICVDTDPINATFAGYKAFDVKRIELLNGSKIDESKFDDLMEIIASNPDSEIIIDNGASSFIPLSSYLVENNAFSMLDEMGHTVFIHTVITGGQALLDTISGLDSLAAQFPNSAKIIVWLNQYFGSIEYDGKTFEEMKVYKNHKERIDGLITIKKQSDLFASDLKNILEQKLTFEQASKIESINFMAKNRLKIMKEDLWSQINLIL